MNMSLHTWPQSFYQETTTPSDLLPSCGSLIKNINLVKKKKKNLFVAFSLSETIFKLFPIKLLQLRMFSRKEQLLKRRLKLSKVRVKFS